MLKKLAKSQLFYLILLVLTCGAFLFLAFTYAHQLPSRVDEGSFLIKGYYYWIGKYQPFQDYGPWTNNMPLAYFIPGLAQFIFGPGLRTGRYFMIFLTFLTFIALFLLVFRLKGKWWAFLTVLPLMINPSLIALSIQAISEGVVACQVAWMMYFLIGKERKNWQIAAGSLLSALAVLTRQNMILLVPFVLVYAFWMHGKRRGWIAVIFSILPLLAGHLIYYPGIFKLWLAWLPGSLKRIFNFTNVEGGGLQAWKPDVEFFSRITSFFTTIRYHFIALFGFFLSLLSLPFKKFWQSKHERKLVLLLSVTFLLFFALHAWASLTKNYCVFCFPNYVSFFVSFAIIAGIISLSNILESKDGIFPIPVAFYFLITFTGTFLGNLETIGREIMSIPFPRFKAGRILSGTVELWKLFENRFGWTYEQLLRVIPPVIGLLTSLLILFSLLGIHKLSNKRFSGLLGKYLIISFLIISIIFTPTLVLGGDNFGNTCGGDVLISYEKVGAELQKTIPSGAKVYWSAGSVVTPLLYITNTEIHPPQLNGIYSARRGGDRELLEKAGYYNGDSREAWRAEDDYFLISYTSVTDFWRDFLDPELFNEYQPTSPLDPCEPNSFIRIYRRK